MSPVDDAAGLEHENEVGVYDRRQAMRDDEHRPSGEQPIDGLLHQPLRLRVQRRRRLVEDEDRRIDEQRAGDGETLTLAAGQPRAALTEDRVVPIRKRDGSRARSRRAPRVRSVRR